MLTRLPSPPWCSLDGQPLWAGGRDTRLDVTLHLFLHRRGCLPPLFVPLLVGGGLVRRAHGVVAAEVVDAQVERARAAAGRGRGGGGRGGRGGGPPGGGWGVPAAVPTTEAAASSLRMLFMFVAGFGVCEAVSQ